jgi:hypothetical protein
MSADLLWGCAEGGLAANKKGAVPEDAPFIIL